MSEGGYRVVSFIRVGHVCDNTWQRACRVIGGPTYFGEVLVCEIPRWGPQMAMISMLRQLLFIVFVVAGQACATGGIHGAAAPVSWSLGTTDSPDGRARIVCEFGQPQPCVLDRSTPERPRYASFALHLYGPAPTKFTGSFLIAYLDDPDPRRYKSNVELTSEGRDTHQRVFSKVTTVPGDFSVRILLEESRADLPQPRTHELTVPVTVR